MHHEVKSRGGTDVVRHPWFARIYVWMAPAADRAGASKHRRDLLEGLAGRVVEVGAGSGLNFRHYPAAVTEVVAVEPEAVMRAQARRAAGKGTANVSVIDGMADQLPLEARSCDAAVASLVLCSVPSQAAALAEIHRVLKPGGELRFYEHVASANRWVEGLQRLLDRGLWQFLGGGCHCSRDTAAAIRAAGFDIEHMRSFKFGPPIFAAPSAPHILGRARAQS